MSGRRVCKKCGKVYNVNTEMRPKVDGVCDSCGGTLYVREDDSEETVKNRLKVYKDQTLPLRNYYLEKGILSTIDGDRSCEKVIEDIFKLVEVNA